MAETDPLYGDDAYTPGRLRRRPAGESRHSRKFRTFAAGGERLAHRDPSVDISPMHEWQHNSPQKLREYEADPAMVEAWWRWTRETAPPVLPEEVELLFAYGLHDKRPEEQRKRNRQATMLLGGYHFFAWRRLDVPA